MKIILSPTKTMVNKEGQYETIYPLFLKESDILVKKLQALSLDELKTLWGCSEKICLKEYQNIQSLDLYHHLTPALEAYNGLVFKYLKRDLTERDKDYLNSHVYILSGLYGILRMNDGVRPYRLDMGDALGNLYEFWGDKVYPVLKDDVIVNCASCEYSLTIKPYVESYHWIDVDFWEYENNQYKTKGTFAKMARGALTRYCAQNKIESIDALKDFKELGFIYQDTLSDEGHIVFIKES